ncbi:proline-rich protein 36 [Dicentrarchus labrax]|uniref:MBD domain-containing protein n=1 Tax=Dicentrarchus labrax TaxID=13489 RepID=A0A8C4GWC6_DICLA|nr:proline-rich protein 36 [Dicentrarchus labrax]XP_051280211.1 proline-rich protein 36 [Dicentrarchus labrax]XP_051280212.1 proline-rich protein 36 [Dicentrarchus labrax]
MMGGSETVSGDKDGVHTTATHVPIGWQRRMEGGRVIYVSPSGTALSSLDEVKTYLLSDGTCKCGLECPLIIHKVFNFTVGVKVEQHSHPLGKAEQDMTKLCNHRRKVVAMAALCRSMQASQLPFANLHHPEMSSGVDSHDPKRVHVEREEEDHVIYHPKLHPVTARPHSNLHPNPCASPKSSHQFIYPYNGSSPVLHTGTNSHHPLEALRRLHQPPPIPASSSSSSCSSFPSAQRSPRTPTPQNVSQGQRTPKTPETPGSPRLTPLSSPPPSSPMTMGGRGAQTHTHHPHGVIVGGSPLSPSPSLSPSVHNMNCVSPHQRSRHPSASPSPLSDQGGGSTAAAAGGGLMGSNLSQRRKSTSSSPHSPLSSGSPNPSPHFPKYKLEDILEQFKNSGNSSTNNHHLLISTNPSLITNQSSSNLHTLSSKPSKITISQIPSSVPPSFGLNSAGPSSLPLGPFLNHHSHQSKLPHPASFPASSLLSAAAKAQLANQITQGQSSNVASNPVSLPSSLEAQQQQSSKVTNSTLHNSHPPSSIASTRPPHPSLAAASSVLFPQSHSLAQSLASSLPHLPPTAERNASHRKRQRRSPTVLSMLRDTQQLANGPRKTPPGDAVTATAINLSSSSSSFPSSHSSSTSAVQNQNAVTLESHHHLLPGQMPRLPAPRQIAHLSRPPRQNEALDFTTGLTPTPLGLDPPTQPLSALLHLLSVQNAQATASASNSASAQPGSVSIEGGGHTNKQSPRLSPSSPSPHSNARHRQTQSPCRTSNTNPLPSVPQPLSPPTFSQFRSVQSPSHPQSTKSSPLQRHSPSSTVLPNSNLALHNSSSPSQHMSPPPSDKHQQTENHIPTIDSVSQAPLREASPQGTVAREIGSNSISTSVDLSHSQGSVSMAISSSPKPLDLSNHVLALLAASSTVPQGEGCSSDRNTDVVMSSQGNPTAGPEEPRCMDPKVSIVTKPPAATSPGPTISSRLGDNHSPHTPSAVGDSSAPLPLAEAFPFMNQEQLLQLLSSTGGLPSLLDPAVLASLPLGGLWLGGQHAQIPPSNATPHNLAEQQQSEQQQLLIQQQETQQQNQDQHQKQQQINNNPLFPLLPLLSGAQGELPLNLLGLLNPLPAPSSTPNPGQEADLGLTEKPSLQALLMASLLFGQQQAPLLPLSGLGQLSQVSLEVPLQQPQQLEGLTLDKTSGLLDPSTLQGPGLLEVAQGLLSIPPGAEASIQALQSLLLPATLPPPPAAFLPLSPALLTAALSSAELHPPPHTHLAPAQQTQHTQPQVSTDAGVDTLIPLSLQGKDNPILQQLLPTLLNPAVLGDLSAITGLHNILGIGAGSILLPPVQTSALGMPLLHGPDGAINLLNNIQLNLAPPSEGEKPVSLQETQSPAPQEDIPASQIAPEVVPSPLPAQAPAPTQETTPPPQRVSEGRSVIDPYTSFMDTIYTSFLQVSAKEQEERAHLGPSDPTSPFCALPPVSFPMEHHTPSTPVSTLPQASAPVSLSPRRACSLRNPDLSRLSLEAAAHSPAQGTPKPTEDGSTLPLQRKPVMVEGHTHPEPPLPPIYLEEAKTDCTGPAAAVCPYVEAGVDRQGHLSHAGYLSPRDGCSGRPNEETAGTLLHTEQGRDQAGPAGGARRGRKRKQTLQNVLEDFRDMDATALEETKATTALLKPERSVRGRRRRGARSQRQ